MGFSLRYRQRDFPLGEGEFTIGRSEDSSLCLDDPLASRRHAILDVKENGVTVRDAGSRNGIRVNGEKVSAPRELSHGDVIRVGSQELTLLKRGSARVQTIAQGKHVTHKLQAFGVLGGLADKAIALGHGDEAERILARQLDHMVEIAEQGPPLEEENFEKATNYGRILAELTGKGRWVDYLFRLHAAHVRLMKADLVDRLYVLGRQVRGSQPAHLRAYLGVLRDSDVAGGPSARFIIGRLEGLQSVLR